MDKNDSIYSYYKRHSPDITVHKKNVNDSNNYYVAVLLTPFFLTYVKCFNFVDKIRKGIFQYKRDTILQCTQKYTYEVLWNIIVCILLFIVCYFHKCFV